MFTEENDLKQKAENKPVPAGTGTRAVLGVQDLWRELVLSGASRTEEDVQRLGAWRGERLRGTPFYIDDTSDASTPKA